MMPKSEITEARKGIYKMWNKYRLGDKLDR